MKGYIYKITNLLNWKCYIGQTIQDPEIRWKNHIRDSKSDKRGHCKKLYRAFKKYNLDYFSFEVIATVDRYDEKEVHQILDELEIYYIEYYDSINWGYNIEEGGSGHSTRRFLYLEYDREGNLLDVWKATENINACNYASNLKYGRISEPDNWCPKYIQVYENWLREVIEDTE